MRAFLNVRGLLYVVENGIQSSSSSVADGEKMNRAYAVLLQSLNSKQLALIEQVQFGNAHEVWTVLNKAYGVVKTTDTQVSLLDQLHNLKKGKTEAVCDYFARVNRVIF